MPPTATSDEIKHELKATLAARRDVGTEYDDHFVESFMDKLKAQVVQEVRAEVRAERAPTRVRQPMTVEQRLRVAVISIVLLFILLAYVALTGLSYGGFYGDHYRQDLLCFACGCVIILYNVAINIRLRIK